MEDRSATALKAYREKRNFDVTPEPAAGGLANEQARAFVIQKHWASRLHYDFRIELGDTMKSWAVPKGPSYDPADKRMAVHVEDHPISYNDFEGTIPPKQYGAGKVIVWDKGTWIPLDDPQQGYREGKLKFELRGHKMRGHWTLVRMKARSDERQEAWLLIKEKDSSARPGSEFSVVDEMPDSVKHLPDVPVAVASAPPSPSRRAANGPDDGPPRGARKASLPRDLRPQLATLVDKSPTHAQDWSYEIKFDGYRMLARAEGGQLALLTRNGHDWTAKLPQLERALATMDLPDGWYDGEIIMPGERVPADFQALQGAFDSARTGEIVYFLFDLPYCAGHDLREVPLVERRAILQRVVERKPHDKVRFSATFEAKPEDVVASACRLGLEGVIAKRKDSAYVSRRSSDWVKLKCGQRQEFVIGGFTDPKGSRTGIGSLILGVHGKDGRLVCAGNVGTGFNERVLRELRGKLEVLAVPKSPFTAGAVAPPSVHWVRPDLVCEVAFGEWTRDGRIRHAVFHGLRDDKPAASVIREEPLYGAPPAGKRALAAKTRSGAPTRSAEAKPEKAGAPTLPASLRVSNPDRIIDATTDTTKIDLVRFYALVGPLMMEHLKGRPVSLVRAPKGIAGELFFQKHAERYVMPGVIQLDPTLFPGHPPMLEVASTQGLLSAAQMNVVEFHTWNGVKAAIGKPDRMTFDLDPGEGVSWTQVQEATQLVYVFLQELGLKAYLKTSGGKG
ncbi:MAG: DNA ligase D, partial [Ramlibacter sp.]